MADSFWVIDSEENLTDSCVRASESYSDINDSTAFDRGSDAVLTTVGAHVGALGYNFIRFNILPANDPKQCIDT